MRLPIPVGRTEGPSYMSNLFLGGTSFDLSWARLHGQEIKYIYNKLIRDKITDWSTSTDSVSWDIDVEQAGDYEVIFQYGCSPADSGSRIRITAGGASIEGTVEATASADAWQERSVGTLPLTPGRSRLEIRPVSMPGRRVLDLHELRLKWLRSSSSSLSH